IGREGNVPRMGFDQYHEPPDELPAQTRTFARMCASLTEEAEAIGWYEQRIAIETDREAVAGVGKAPGEALKQFAIGLEDLARKEPRWREIAQGILVQGGEIGARGEEAEEGAAEDIPGTPDEAPSLGIGGLR